jgi:hypothetical protein
LPTSPPPEPKPPFWQQLVFILGFLFVSLWIFIGIVGLVWLTKVCSHWALHYFWHHMLMR